MDTSGTAFVIGNSPVDKDDLDRLSELLRAEPPIVSALQDFSNGDWREFFHEHVRHGTEFVVSLDANFMSHLLRVFSPGSLPDLSRHAAALMSLAIAFNMKVNPTFASHEYAFTGNGDADVRLAAFYFLNNMHPQRLADIALGRMRGWLPDPESLPCTQFKGTHRERLRTWGLTYTSLLKIVELHRCTPALSQKRDLRTRFARVESLLDWMYSEFFLCNSPLVVADQLWGKTRMKTILKGIDSCDRTTVIPICQNAAWDLVLAENWALSEGNRAPGDPIHLIFSFDKVLRGLAGELLVKHNEVQYGKEYWVTRRYEKSWPADMAAGLASRYLAYEADSDSPIRQCNRKDKPSNDAITAELEDRLCELL